MKIIFYKNKGEPLDILIRLITNGKYSHCELIFSDGVCFSSSPRDGGVRFSNIALKDNHWDYLELEVDDEEKIYNWCKQYVGQKYDWLGAISCVYPIVQGAKNRWFCSEICIKCLIDNNIIDEDLLPVKSSPSTLYDILVSLITK